MSIDKDERNPCTYKAECRNCTHTDIEDRPDMCDALECEHLTPCKKCKRNLALDEKNVCTYCKRRIAIEDEAPAIVKTKEGVTVAVPQHVIDSQEKNKNKDNKNKDSSNGSDGNWDIDSSDSSDSSNNSAEYVPVSITVTRPGVPPEAFSDDEKEYYMEQWSEYAGYYRDPTAYALIHQIIIIEIQMNWLTSYMIQTRGEYKQALDQQRGKLIDNLKKLRDQLPEKEASDLSDDEKSIAMIYDGYLKEKGNRELGGVRRLFTEDAVALSPRLHFPTDLSSLLQRAGFRIVDIGQVVESFEGPPGDPESIAEFFGFRLSEKFAMANDKSKRDDLDGGNGSSNDDNSANAKTEGDLIFSDDELGE